MARSHHYELSVRWTGDLGAGTSGPRAYSRAHEVTAPGKPAILGSSDPSFRGDRERWNPEELLVAALSQCHLLWYLGLAAEAGVVVVGYQDSPIGVMSESADGSGQFESVTLRPAVTVTEPAMVEQALALHAAAHATCFIARSVNFPVGHEPVVVVAPRPHLGS